MSERSDSPELRRKAARVAKELVENISPMDPESAAIAMDVGTEAYLRGHEDGVAESALRDYHTS